ncbi:MAG: hypothetical protein ISS14_00355 [Actinobacteria bacterium]|nr:hypothetical protein [Actinomycetota bacterium]
MLTMWQKKAVIAEFKKRYSRLSKKEKVLVLDQFTTLTGYNRSYASGILNLREGKVVGYAKVYGMRIRYVIGKNKMIKRKRVEYMALDIFSV